MKKKILIIIMCVCMMIPTLALVSFADEIDFSTGLDVTACKEYAEDAKYKVTFTPNYKVGDTAPIYAAGSLPTPSEYSSETIVFYVSNVTSTSSDYLNEGWNNYYICPRYLGIESLADGRNKALMGLQIADSTDSTGSISYSALFWTSDQLDDGDISKTDCTISSIPWTGTIEFYVDDTTYIESLLSAYSGQVIIEEQNISSGTSSGAVVGGGAFVGLVGQIFDGFGTAINGSANGMKTAFNGLIYADGTSGSFSPLVIFLFAMLGLALATGIVYKIFTVIKNRR